MGGDALSVVGLELVMHTTARSVRFRRKTEMDAQRLSTWAVQKLICFMSGRNTASKRDDDRVAFLNPCCLVSLLLHLGNIINKLCQAPKTFESTFCIEYYSALIVCFPF